ncbi:glycosyltransferase [Candidatus Minimicrobia vallesae]|uniref:glycosyltransferase n=1 Tax=Candidatus Minimicrobia vallesae TaxID=2841264 RepID=UPI002FCDDC3A
MSYINLSRNFGKEIAMIAGIDHVKSDALVIIDADLQDPPELIQEMISYWENDYDDVYARRNNRQGETWLKKKTSQWYYRRYCKNQPTSPFKSDTGDFQTLDHRCIEALQKFRESQRNTKAIFSWIGYKKKEIFYNRDPKD